MIGKCNCFQCIYFVAKDFPHQYRCKFERCCSYGLPNQCHYDRLNIPVEIAEKVLHDFQKYRRGKGTIKDCPPSYLIGVAIDKAIRTLRFNEYR